MTGPTCGNLVDPEQSVVNQRLTELGDLLWPGNKMLVTAHAEVVVSIDHSLSDRLTTFDMIHEGTMANFAGQPAVLAAGQRLVPRIVGLGTICLVAGRSRTGLVATEAQRKLLQFLFGIQPIPSLEIPARGHSQVLQDQKPGHTNR